MFIAQPFIFGLVFFGVGVYIFIYGFTRLRKKRLIENIPTSTIRGMAMGLVELCGKAKKIALLKSPFTQTSCVLFKYTVEEYKRRGKNSQWVTIASGDSFLSPFWLEDSTGKVKVFPLGAELACPRDYEFETGWLKPLPENLAGFLETKGIRYQDWAFPRTLRFREWLICDDEEVYVLGSAQKAELKDGEYKEKLFGRLEKLKSSPVDMAKFDLNKDGEVSIEEWDMAVAKIEQELLEEVVRGHALEEHSDVIVGRGEEEKVFIISDYSQKILTRRLLFEFIGCVCGGVIFALMGLFCMLIGLSVI